MTVYVNTNSESLFSSVEFSPLPDGNFTFFHLRNAEQKDKAKQWLGSQGVAQKIVAETLVGGQPVLVTHGDKTNDALMSLLAAGVEKFVEPAPEKKFKAWKWRGNLCNLGQSLNLVSGYRKPGGLDVPKLTFAGLNFAASYINSTFGGQKSEDEYQLRHLKSNINKLLGKHVAAGTLPDVNDDRSGSYARKRRSRKPPAINSWIL